MASRQERRKAERDAAKRAPAKAGAAAAAAAPTTVNVTPLGDWTTQNEDPTMLFRGLGDEIVEQRAGAGDGEAQFSLGWSLVNEADGGAGTKLGEGGRSPKADVGLALCTAQFPGLSPDSDASMRPPDDHLPK
jgi:hypothetical protein